MRLEAALAVPVADGGGDGAAIAVGPHDGHYDGVSVQLDALGQVVLTWYTDRTAVWARTVALEEPDAYALARAVMRASAGALTGTEANWEPVAAPDVIPAADDAPADAKPTRTSRGATAAAVNSAVVAQTVDDAEQPVATDAPPAIEERAGVTP